MFDRSKLILQPLSKRKHGLNLSVIKPLEKVAHTEEAFNKVALRITAAKKRKRSVILMIGGHVIRSGVQRYIIDLLEKRYITCIAMNGGSLIHDYEFALIGATTESVEEYIKKGCFGLWKETSRINDIVNESYDKADPGMGWAVGKAISEGNFPHKDISITAACYRLDIPATVHVGIGYDIIHEHPNFNGAATGEMSHRDFLRFTEAVSNLEEGIVMNFGSAVMAPEVFLKALSMARNVSHQNEREIKKFTSLVCDLHDLPRDFVKEPSKNNEFYYFRPWKTMLVRTVANGGESFYVKGVHAETIPSLWSAIINHQEP